VCVCVFVCECVHYLYIYIYTCTCVRERARACVFSACNVSSQPSPLSSHHCRCPASAPEERRPPRRPIKRRDYSPRRKGHHRQPSPLNVGCMVCPSYRFFNAATWCVVIVVSCNLSGCV
jgi:hypothetical protein